MDVLPINIKMSRVCLEPGHEFFMGKHPVTQEEWRVVATELPRVKYDLNPNPSAFTVENQPNKEYEWFEKRPNRESPRILSTDLHPVEQVTWLEAVEFCQRISKATGLPFRLPSEAKMEAVCKAAATSPFSIDPLNFKKEETRTIEVIDYNDYVSCYLSIEGEYRDGTVPVKTADVNIWGLYDLHSNVWEWCEDSSNNGSSRILRGISSEYSILRSSYPPEKSLNSIGFRVCCSCNPCERE